MKIFKSSLVGLTLLFVQLDLNAEIISGLEKKWSFNGDFSESINGVNGTGVNNPIFSDNTHDGAGQSLSLNGYNQKVVVDNVSDGELLTDFSFSIWFRLNTASGRTYLLDNRGDGTTSSWHAGKVAHVFLDERNDGNLMLTMFYNSSVILGADDGSWHNLFYNNNTSTDESTIYYDNEIVFQDVASINAYDFNNGMVFGTYGKAVENGNYWTDGNIDDVSLWNSTATTVNEEMKIQSQLTATVPLPTSFGLLALTMVGFGARRK